MAQTDSDGRRELPDHPADGRAPAGQRPPTPAAPSTPRRKQRIASMPSWAPQPPPELAHQGGGAAGGVAPGGPPAATCPKPSGRLKANTLGPLKLGFTRAHARRTLKRFTTRHAVDSFCVSPRGACTPRRLPDDHTASLAAQARAKAAGRQSHPAPDERRVLQARRDQAGNEAHQEAQTATAYAQGVPRRRRDLVRRARKAERRHSSRSSARSSRRSGSATVSCLLTHAAAQRLLVSFKSSRP